MYYNEELNEVPIEKEMPWWCNGSTALEKGRYKFDSYNIGYRGNAR
jgi:hypothetical protein